MGAQFGSHGTQVAGIIGAAWENGLGGVGVMGRIDEVNPAGARVTIIPIQACDVLGECSDWSLIQAILYAGGLPASGQGGNNVLLSPRAEIVNMSVAGPLPTVGEHLAVQLATAAGALLIASAGNSGSPLPEFPAFYQEVVSVSALDTGNDQLAGFSSFGKIELTAPGVSVTTTAVDYRNCGVVTPSPIPCAVTTYNSFFSGTSAAAPHVTAIAALYKAHDDTRTNVVLRQMLIDNAADWGSPGPDVYFGAGLVQAAPGRGVPLVSENGPRMAYLVHRATGEIHGAPVSPANGSFQFTNVPAGLYSLLAAVDADGDGIFAETGEAVGAAGGGALQYAQTRLLPAGTLNGTINFALDWPGDEQEVTNDSSQTATPIFPGFYVEVTTAKVGDVDWFSFVAPETGIYHIWTEGRNTTLCREEFKDMNSRVRLYEDLPLGPDVDSTGSGCADIRHPLTKGKLYYLQVESEGAVVGVKTIVRVDPD